MPSPTSTHSTSAQVTETQPPPWLSLTAKGKEKMVESASQSPALGTEEEEASDIQSGDGGEDSEKEVSPDSDAEEEEGSGSMGEGSSRTTSCFNLTGPPPPSRNPRTSEEERVTVLRGDPFVNYFDPQNVQCKNCGKVIKLYGKNYYLKGWNNHREGCIKPDTDPDKLPIIPPPTLPIIPKKRLQARKGPPENRIKELNQDPQVDSFDNTHIVCKFCGRKIGMNTNYNLGAWKAHKSSCKGTPHTVNSSKDPSGAVRSRTNEQERILELENDQTVLTFGPDFVLCKLCQQSIKLSGPYYLTTWHRHKYSCQEKHYDVDEDEFVKDTKPTPRPLKRTYWNPFDPDPTPRPRLLGNGFRPLSAIVATTGLYDWSTMPSYTGNTCPQELSSRDETPGGRQTQLAQASFKTSNEIAHSMNIAFAKAGLLGMNQPTNGPPGAGNYLGLMQTHAAESLRGGGSLSSGRYPKPFFPAGPSTAHKPYPRVAGLQTGIHDPRKTTIGSMVAVSRSSSAAKLDSDSEPKAKRPRKSKGSGTSTPHEQMMQLDHTPASASPTSETPSQPADKVSESTSSVVKTQIRQGGPFQNPDAPTPKRLGDCHTQ